MLGQRYRPNYEQGRVFFPPLENGLPREDGNPNYERTQSAYRLVERQTDRATRSGAVSLPLHGPSVHNPLSDNTHPGTAGSATRVSGAGLSGKPAINRIRF